MNTPTTDKNIAAWNDQPLDNYEDIIISFDYARFSDMGPPTGGFAIIFFDSIVDMPHYGGPGYSLGYTPSTQQDFCKLDGYFGLEGAYLGIGFDRFGFFATQTDSVDGLTANYSPNSFAVRGGVEDNYRLLYNSSDISYLSPSLANFTVDQRINNPGDIVYRSIRIILRKAATEIKVQVKVNSEDTEFIDIGAVDIASNHRTSLKVGITNTTTDPFTKMLIKNFNVAGFPGDTTTVRLLSGCQQIINLQGWSFGSILPFYNEFFTTSTGNELITQTSDTTRFFKKNSIFSGHGFDILGAKTNFVLARNTNANILLIYRYLGERLVRTYGITTPCGSQPLCADIDNDNTLVVCTSALSGSAYIYTYNTESSDPAILGTWSLYQTLVATEAMSGAGMGISCSLNENNLLLGNKNQRVHAYQKNSFNSWTYIQTISDPLTGITKFGYHVTMEGRDAIIAAPYSVKAIYDNPGQGEVYHYFLRSATNVWERVMNIGSFFHINTPAGNFGTSIDLHNNQLIVGSPGEMYLEDLTQTEETEYNVGRAYVFNKTENGYFTQSKILFPDSSFRKKSIYYGSAVGIYNNYAVVIASRNDDIYTSFATVYNLACDIALPPAHLPIPDCAIALVDGSGFIISNVNNTYLLSFNCVNGS
jgi:hypothetical protein